MYTTMLDSTETIKNHKFMSGFKLLGNSGSLKSIVTNYVLSANIHPLAIEFGEGESVSIIYLYVMDKSVEG